MSYKISVICFHFCPWHIIRLCYNWHCQWEIDTGTSLPVLKALWGDLSWLRMSSVLLWNWTKSGARAIWIGATLKRSQPLVFAPLLMSKTWAGVVTVLLVGITLPTRTAILPFIISISLYICPKGLFLFKELYTQIIIILSYFVFWFQNKILFSILEYRFENRFWLQNYTQTFSDWF